MASPALSLHSIFEGQVKPMLFREIFLTIKTMKKLFEGSLFTRMYIKNELKKEFRSFYPGIQNREHLTPEQDQETASVDPEAVLLADLGYIKILQVWSELGKKKVSKRAQDSGDSGGIILKTCGI